MSSDLKRLILFLLSSIFYTSLSLPYALFSSSSSCSSLPFPPSCSSHSPLTPRSPLDIFNYEIPSINVNLDSLIDEFSGAPCRRSVAVTDSPEGDAVPEEEPQSTTLWPMTLRHHSLPAPPWLYILLTVATKAWWTHTDTHTHTGLTNAHLKPELICYRLQGISSPTMLTSS